jgi:hypothetical protein
LKIENVRQHIETSQKIRKETNKMTDKKDVKSVKDLILKNEELQARIDFLQQENNRLLKDHRDLTEENSFYKRQVNGLKFRCGDYRRELDRVTSLSMFEFANEFCNDNELEEAGHALARDLLGKPMTPADIAEEEFISQGEQHYADTWNINCGDDF